MAIERLRRLLMDASDRSITDVDGWSRLRSQARRATADLAAVHLIPRT